MTGVMTGVIDGMTRFWYSAFQEGNTL